MPSATVAATRNRKLPSDEELQRMREAGMSLSKIAEEYGASYEAVRLRFKSMGVQATKTHIQYGLPWSIRPDHNNHSALREWKKWKRRQLGVSRSEEEAASVDLFVAFMEGNNSFGVPLSIGYDRMEGFFVRRRRVGDSDYLTTAP
jgi:hypothetical protein